jgi:hypothetical protein
MGRHNNSLELTPGVRAGSVAAFPNKGGGCPVVGGAAQLYVRSMKEAVHMLCDTFRALSFRTWDVLAQSRRVGHQPLEETFTDLNLLELKVRHPFEIKTITFTKPQEGINGADWEWWLTDVGHSQWLGIRVQAKVLDLKTNEFKHLHYKKGKIYQSNKLKSRCAAAGLIPLYCIYVHFEGNPRFGMRCPSFPPANESYGCSITPISTIDLLRNNGLRKNLGDIGQYCLPWHCLVCCKGYGGTSLPDRAWSFLIGAFGIEPNPNPLNDVPVAGPRNAPPDYVVRLLGNEQIEPPDDGIKHITVITEEKAESEYPN